MDHLIFRLLISLSIGLLVGLERGWRERHGPAGSRTAGFRTYGIIGFLGGIFGALAQTLDAPYIFSVGFAGFALIFGWFCAQEAKQDKSNSVTAAITGLCVFALGGMAVLGDYKVAAGCGTALATILASREILHQLLKKVSWVELRSALILAVMTTIILPLLPDRAIDPWGGFNPWEVWFFTVLTAAISYIGYIASRILGTKRGLLVSGITGGLVSSTAVTVAFAVAARSSTNKVQLAGAASCAAMMSLLRVSAIVGILQPTLLVIIIGPTLTAASVLGLWGLFLLRKHETTVSLENKPLQNPFRLAPLLIFACGFAGISTISAALVPKFGTTSMLLTSALSGMFDVDVAVLSAVRLFSQSIQPTSIGYAILVSLCANAFGRLFLAVLAGPRSYWAHLLIGTAMALGAGALVLYAFF